MTRKNEDRDVATTEPCPLCDEPMEVTGENVVLGGVNVGMTWECVNPRCIVGRRQK